MTKQRFLKNIPRILVVMPTVEKACRDKLQGIFNYAHLYGPWNIHLVHGRSGEQRPKTVNDLRGYDGIIVGQMTPLQSQIRLLDARLPHGTFEGVASTVSPSCA